MYQNRNAAMPPRKSKARYFKDPNGEIFRTIVLGYTMFSNIQMVALKRVSDMTIWFVPIDLFNDVLLINNEPCPRFVEIFDYTEEDYSDALAKHYSNNTKYPQQSRLGAMQTPNIRNNEQATENPSNRGFQKYHY